MTFTRLDVDSISRAAEDWLIRTRQPQILHIFERSCNLVNERREVASVNFPTVPQTPLAIRLANEAGQLAVSWHRLIAENSPVAVNTRHKVLQLGAAELHWSSAARWNAVPAWSAAGAALHDWPDGFQRLHALIEDEAPPGSLAPLVGENESIELTSGQDEAAPEISRRLLATAGPHARSLVAAISTGELESAQRASEALAGLGTGLTPSGDDFIMGVMHALWALRSPTEAAQVCAKLLAVAGPRTSALSAGWLRAAARGEAGEHWHDLTRALQRKNDVEVDQAARPILATGHTSGADAMAGFLMALQAFWIQDDIAPG